MAAPQPGVTLTFTLNTSPTQLSTGLSNRRGFLIQNNDTANNVSVGFGTLNNATASPLMFVILPGSIMSMGESNNASGTGPQAGSSVPNTDISATSVAGTPEIAFMEW